MSIKAMLPVFSVTVFSIFLSACISTDVYDKREYSVRKISENYSNGTYIEKYKNVPYRDKVNICILGYTRFRPGLSGIAGIFANEDYCTANLVLKEIGTFIEKKDPYMVWMMTNIWIVIARNNKECWAKGNVEKLLSLLNTDPKAYDISIAAIESEYKRYLEAQN